MQRALELDPLNDFNRSFYGWHLNYLRRYGEAIPIFEQLLPSGPNKASNYLGLWGAFFRTGRYEDASARRATTSRRPATGSSPPRSGPDRTAPLTAPRCSAQGS